MKSQGILFKEAMVRAILDGRKTQTRRLVKPQPSNSEAPWPDNGSCITISDVMENPDYYSKCSLIPYPPGTILYIKETFSLDAVSMYPCPPVWYRATDDIQSDGIHTCPKSTMRLIPWADCLACWEKGHGKFKWKPSIFMPRALSRLWLRVTNVRVERLQSISEEDAIAEGVDLNGPVGHIPTALEMGKARYQYANLWNSINGQGSWDANPFVWVYSFERIERPAI